MYLNIEDIRKYFKTFNFIFGARGTGKTYSVLLDLLENDVFFIYLRRTQKELDRIARKILDTALSPFEPINNDYPQKYNIEVKKIDDNMYCAINKKTEKTVALLMSLSTFAGIRGASLNDVDAIVYDEFNPELHVRLIKNEDDAFFNMYETVCRNRELKGENPVVTYFLGNTNNLENAILRTLGLQTILEKMEKNNKKVYVDKKRGISMIRMDNNDFYDAKKETALYKLTSGTRFSEMALDNKFSYNDFSDIKKCDIKQYKKIISCPDFVLWQHKSLPMFYVSDNFTKTNDYGDTPQDKIAIKLKLRRFYTSYVGRNIKFMNFSVKELFTKYL